MAVKYSTAAMGNQPIPYPPNAGGVVAERFAYSTILATGDIIEMAPIPVGLKVVDIVMDSADLDSGTPALVIDVGIMSGNFGDKAQDRTCGAEFFSASTIGQAGGVARPTLASAYKTGKANNERSIGIKVTTPAGTPAAGAIGLTVFYAS